MNKIYAFLMIVIGIALMIHHYLTTGIIFDLNDIIGHDWLGLVLVACGVICWMYKAQ
jgi:hypothetical protein